MTPEEREAIELRMAKIKTEMATMNPLRLDSMGVEKWTKLYAELDALELQLEAE